jgi:hypothetical protein
MLYDHVILLGFSCYAFYCITCFPMERANPNHFESENALSISSGERQPSRADRRCSGKSSRGTKKKMKMIPLLKRAETHSAGRAHRGNVVYWSVARFSEPNLGLSYPPGRSHSGYCFRGLPDSRLIQQLPIMARCH